MSAIFGFESQRNPITEEASYQKAGATILNSNLRNLKPGIFCILKFSEFPHHLRSGRVDLKLQASQICLFFL